MIRRSGFHYPDVILAATIDERNRLGAREAYYVAKNLRREGQAFVQGAFSAQVKIAAASRVCQLMIHEEYIDRLLAHLLQASHTRPGARANGPLRVKIVSPRPLTNEQSANALAPVFTELLVRRLRETGRDRGLHSSMGFSVERDLRIYALGKVGRTVSFSAGMSREEKLQDVAGLLARQPLFGGTVDREACYVLADDSVRRQSTFANLAAFIDAQGGTIGAATALIGVPESTTMQAQPASVSLLQEILLRRGIAVTQVNAVLGNPSLFANLHLRIGGAEHTTLTNLEHMLLISYFGNAQVQRAFEEVLEIAGCQRDAQGHLSDYLHLSALLDLERPAGTPEELQEIFSRTIKGLRP